jgi:hypothetical protein
MILVVQAGRIWTSCNYFDDGEEEGNPNKKLHDLCAVLKKR